METYIGGDGIAKATRIGWEERGKEGGEKALGEKREGTRGRERTEPSLLLRIVLSLLLYESLSIYK